MPPKTNQQVIDESKIAAQNVLNISGVSGGAYSPQAITSEQLKPSSPLVIPPTPQNTNNDLGIIAGIAGNLATLTGQQTAQEQLNKTSENDITSLMNQLTGKASDTQNANEVSGLNASTKQLNDLNAQAQSLYRESQAIPIQIQQDITGRMVTKAGSQTMTNEALRTNALKALSIAQQTDIAQANYTSAKDKAQQIVDLKYQPLEQQLAIKQQQYLFNKDALERVDKKRADALGVAIEQEKQAIANKKEDANAIQAMAMTALKNNPNDQQAQMAVNQAIASGDLKKAFSLLGQYQDDPLETRSKILENDLKRKQLDVLDATIRKTNDDAQESEQAKATSKKMATLDPNSPTLTMDMIRASAGGKTPTGEQTKPINKATLVLSQLADLQANVSKASTGPILGILRDNNPYDVKAQLIKAQLQAITPNLARGVYGEVGVLTDNDIKNYIQTLPNLKKPEEVNKLILAMTLKVVKNSVDSNLQVLSAEGRDVSGFEPILTKFDNKISELEKVSSKTTKMTGPDGKSYNVPNEQVNAFIKAGGKKQ
jgi:hypothetical protein